MGKFFSITRDSIRFFKSIFIVDNPILFEQAFLWKKEEENFQSDQIMCLGNWCFKYLFKGTHNFFCDDFNYKWYYMKNWQSWKIEFLNLLLLVFIHRTSFMCDFHYGTCRNYITLLCTYCSCPNSESLCSCTDLQSLHTSHQLVIHTHMSFIHRHLLR